MKQIIRGAGALGLAIALAACGSAPASPDAGTSGTTTTGVDPMATSPSGTDPMATSPSGADTSATSATGADTSATSATGADTSATSATGADTSATSATGADTSATSSTGADTSATSPSGADTSATSATTETDSVLGAAASDPRFSTLTGLLVSSGLDTQLEALGPFTLFAPSNEAFEALPAGTLESLAQNPSLLQQILLYHVAEGAIRSDDITGSTTATTAEGQDLTISDTGSAITVNETAEIIDTDIEAGQGVIHLIDEVLLPPGVALDS